MKHTLVLLCLALLFFSNGLLAQEDEKKEKKEKKGKSPVELMFEYYNEDFKPFGNNKWFTGLTFNIVDDKLSSDRELLGLEQVISSHAFNYNINIKGGYFIGNYSMLGVGITHGRDKGTGTGIILMDTLYSESITNRNAFTPFLRSYYPLSKNHRLSFFNELKMSFGFENTTDTKTQNNVESGKTESETFVFGLGLSPGITFFAIESFAFEIQLDVLGYKYETTTSRDETGQETKYDSHNVNFTLNLLSLNFGLAYYFGAKK